MTPATLTITANDQSKVFGADDPIFTFTYTGLVNSDTKTTTEPTCSASDPHTDAGTYPITCSGAVDTNYNIGYVSGTLTVGKSDQAITNFNLSPTKLTEILTLLLARPVELPAYR